MNREIQESYNLGRLSAFKEMRDYNLECLEENRLLILTARERIKELSDNGSPKEISEQVLLLQETLIRQKLFTSYAEHAEKKMGIKYRLEKIVCKCGHSDKHHKAYGFCTWEECPCEKYEFAEAQIKKVEK